MSDVTLIHGDCLEYMRTMKNDKFDFCFTDVPYNVSKDYGEYKDNLSDDDYLEWSGKVIAEIKRVSKFSCIFVPTKYIREYWWMLGSDYKQIVLSYGPTGAIRWGYSNQFSTLLTNTKPNKIIKNVWHNCQMTGLGYFFKESNYGHPGYTSEDITGRVVESFTLQGQSVIDPFSGTGTTGVECVKRDRKYTGIEQELKWFELSEKRIHDAQQQMRLF